MSILRTSFIFLVVSAAAGIAVASGATAAPAGTAGPGAAPARSHVKAPAAPLAPTEAYALLARWTSDDVAAPPDALLEPTGIDVDAFDGRVFVVDTGNDRVQVFEGDGTYVRTIGGDGSGSDSLLEPTDVAVQGSLIFVTDTGNDRVAVFSLDGTLVESWPDLAGPTGIAAGVDGRVIVAMGSEAAVFRADGQRLETWRYGASVLRGVDTLADGRVVFTDQGLSRVFIVQPTGSEQRSTNDLGTTPVDVAVGPGGALFVTYTDGRLVRLEDQFDLPLTSAYPITGVTGVAAGPSDSVVVTFRDDSQPVHGVQVWSGRPLARSLAWGDVPAPLGRFDEPFRLAAEADVLVADMWRRTQRMADGAFLHQVPTGLVNDIADADGGSEDIFVAKDDEVLRLDTTGLPMWTWAVPQTGAYPWIVALSKVPTGTLIALDLGTQTLWAIDPDTGDLIGSERFSPGGRVSVPLWDLSPAQEGHFAVNRRSDSLEVRSPAGNLLRSWAVPGGALRVDSDQSGQAYVLNRHGWVWKYAADGELLAVWDAALQRPESRPIDLAVDRSGRVLVLDQALEAIGVYALDPGGVPGEVPSFEPVCSAGGSKTADPTQLQLGEETTITLEVDGGCPTVESQADIMLVIDISGSMTGPAQGAPGVTKMDAAKDAATAFVEQLDVGRFRTGLVAFNAAANLVTPLTDNSAAVRAGIAGLNAGGGTDIAAGVELAMDELTGPRRRPEVAGVVVLLTDGYSDPAAATRAADRARLSSLRLFTIGFGEQFNTVLLQDMATNPSDFYAAPTAAELLDIYLELAERISANHLFNTLTITDELPGNMAFVAGSGAPPPQVDGQVLTWQLADVPFDGTTLTYRVRPLETGTWPTNRIAWGEGTDGLGQPGQVDFPVPQVDVVAPSGTPPPTRTPTATPTPTLTPTPSPTLVPEPIYLPVLKNERCLKRRQHADVVLLMDTSNSMLDLTSAGRTKLSAAASAAATFVELLNLDTDGARDAAAVVAFNTTASALTPLVDERASLLAALADMPQGAGTRIDRGLIEAGAVLAGPGRTEANLPVVILLTDGRPSGTTPDAVVTAAETLRADGAVLYAIGLGNDVDPELLAEVTDAEERVILAPDGEDLQRIYEEIARELPCIKVTGH